MLHQFDALRHMVKRTSGVWDGAVCSKLHYNIDEVIPFGFTSPRMCTRETGDRPGGASLTANPPPLPTKGDGIPPRLIETRRATKQKGLVLSAREPQSGYPATKNDELFSLVTRHKSLDSHSEFWETC